MQYIGSLKTRVTLRKPKDQSERTGQPVVEFVDAFDAWAADEDLGTRELVMFRQGGMKATKRLTIRWQRTEIDTKWRVLVDGQAYHIESVSHQDNRWTFLTIYRDGR